MPMEIVHVRNCVHVIVSDLWIRDVCHHKAHPLFVNIILLLITIAIIWGLNNDDGCNRHILAHEGGKQ